MTGFRTKQKVERLFAPVREGSSRPSSGWSEGETSPLKNIQHAAEEMMLQIENDMKTTSAKLAAEQAERMVKDSIVASMERIKNENESMRTWEENMVRRSGYHVDGKSIHRDAVVDSSLGHTYYEGQSVHYYEDFYDVGPKISVSFSKEMLNGLTSSAIMLLVEQANYDIENWSKQVFGNTEKDEDGNVVLKQNALAREASYDYDIERYKALSKKDYDKLSEDEQKEFNDLSTGIVSVRDGLLGEWIGYAPVFKDGNSGLDLSNSRESNIKYQGDGQMGQIMLDFQWNNMIEQQGWQKVALPAYDQPLWRGNGSWFEPPTIRGVASIVFEIVGQASSQAWFSYADDLIFAAIDVGGGFKSPEQVGLELAKTAATVVVSMGCSAAGSAIGNVAGKAMEGASKFANFATQAGISAATTYVSTVATSAVNNVQLGADGGLTFDKDAFGKSLYSAETIGSVAGAGMTGGLSSINMRDANNLSLNSHTFKTSEIQALNSLAGGLVQNGVTLAIGGNATFNILNFADIAGMFGMEYRNGKTGAKASTGLLEISFGKDGFKSRFGMGGTNISYNAISNAIIGMQESKKTTAAKYGNIEQQSNLNSSNMLGSTNSAQNRQLSKDIWNGDVNVEYDDLDGEYGHYSHEENTITLDKDLLGGGREGSAKLSSVMSHEGSHYFGNNVEGIAHLTAAETYAKINQIFSLQADTNFSKEMLSGIFDINNWVENSGDIEYWKLAQKDDGSYGWNWDGDFDFNTDMGKISAEYMKQLAEGIKFLESKETQLALGFPIREKEQKKEVVMTSGTPSEETIVSNEMFKEIMNSNGFDFEAYKNFIKETEHFADASIIAKTMIAEVSGIKDGNLSSDGIVSLNKALYAVQESGLLIRLGNGSYENDEYILSENGLSFPVALNKNEKYLRMTSNFGEQLLVDEKNQSIKFRTHRQIDIADQTPGVSNDLIAKKNNLKYLLEYDATYGLNYKVSDGNAKYQQLSHMSSQSILNYISLFSSNGISMGANFALNGIKQNMIIGETGNTGSSLGVHLDYMQYDTNGNIVNPTEMWSQLYSNSKIRDVDEWHFELGTKYTDNIVKNAVFNTSTSEWIKDQYFNYLIKNQNISNMLQNENVRNYWLLHNIPLYTYTPAVYPNILGSYK